MKHFVSEPVSVLRALCCDRCGLMADDGTTEFAEFAFIAYQAGYGSIFGDGNHVEIDLCQGCLQATLGPWLRIKEDQWHASLSANLKAFDPARHGGEWPPNPEQADSSGPMDEGDG